MILWFKSKYECVPNGDIKLNNSAEVKQLNWQNFGAKK